MTSGIDNTDAQNVYSTRDASIVYTAVSGQPCFYTAEYGGCGL